MMFDHSKYQQIILVKNIFLETLKMAKGFCVINLTIKLSFFNLTIKLSFIV